MSTAKGQKPQLEAPRRDIAPTTATGADKTTVTFFHAGAVFLLRMGAVFLLLVVFDAMVDSSEAVGAHPSTQEGSAVRGWSLPAGEEARRLLGGAVQQGLGPLVDVVGSEAELLEQGPGRRRGAVVVEADDLAAVPDPALPPEGDARLDRQTVAAGGRQHALAIGGVLPLEESPGRHVDDPRAHALGDQALVRLEHQGDLTAGADEDHVGGRVAGGVAKNIGAAGDAAPD